jgi:hypothetical protein
VLPKITRYPPSRDLYFEKLSKTRFNIPIRLQTPIILGVEKCLTTTFLFCKYRIRNSTYLFLQFSVHPTSHMTLSHCLSCNHSYFCYTTGLLYGYQFPLNSLIRKHNFPTFRKIMFNILTK